MVSCTPAVTRHDLQRADAPADSLRHDDLELLKSLRYRSLRGAGADEIPGSDLHRARAIANALATDYIRRREGPLYRRRRGNLVEVNVRFKSAKSICAVVTKVRAVGLDEVECEYHDNKRSTVVSALAKFSPAGGPGAASLYCPFFVTEGWKKSPIGPYGGGGFGGFAWSKTSP